MSATIKQIEITTIREIGCFADLPEHICTALAERAVMITRPSGSVLFLEGDPAPGMYVVLSGRIKLSRSAASGREQVIHVATAGQHFNSVPVFDNRPCPADAETLTEARLVLFPQASLRALMLQHPELSMSLLAELGGYLRRLVHLVDTLALHTVQGRLARLLLEQAEAAERGEPIVALTQAEMAARLGTVREMVSRTLKTFESLELIRIERGAIKILNRTGLEQQADT